MIVSHSPTQGSSSDWVLQWVCRCCGSSTYMQDIPALPAVSCSQCSTSASIVFNKPTGRTARFCLSLTTVTVPHLRPCSTDARQSDWFSHSPLTRFASLYGRVRWRPHSSRLWHSILALLSINFAIIRAYADHFHSWDCRPPATALLQSWQRGHLILCTSGCHPPLTSCR